MFFRIFCSVAILSVLPYVWVLAQTSPGQTGQTDHQNTDNQATGMAAAAQGGPRRWQVAHPQGVAVYQKSNHDSPVIETLPDGAMLSNLGCKPEGKDVWCAVQPLHSRGRGYVPADFLRPARGPEGTIPMGIDDSRLRAGKDDFDATGDLSCAQERGQNMGRCRFGIAYSSGGDATVVVTFANGFKRMLFFVNGAFISANTTMSGNGFDTDWRMENGHHLIRVDDQRYAVPDSIITGG